MPEWWVGPLVTIVVALVGVSGVWIGVLVSKRQKERELVEQRLQRLEERIDVVNRRNFILINYAQRLRDHIYRGDPPPPEEWPEDLYDQS